MRCIGLSLALCLVCAPAAAQTDGVYTARIAPSRTSRTIEVPYGSSSMFLLLNRPLPVPRSQVLASTDNLNRQYSFHVVYRRRSCPTQVVLLIGGVPAPAPSFGYGRGECAYDFPIDRAMADRVAHAFGVVRRDRSPIGESVSARFWTARNIYGRTESIEVRATLTNPPGAQNVLREAGCIRFSFVIDRDEQRVGELAVSSWACPVGYAPHPGGASVDDHVDVRAWASNVAPGMFDVPGRYRLWCRYETSFALAPPFGTEDFSARIWTRTFTGIVELTVR